jgi:hypothetical protein
MKFKDWFERKLTVGSFPFMNNEHINAFDYDYVINVSDEFHPEHHIPLIVAGCKTFWFPMNECRRDIGLNSIYGALCILWLAEKENKHVYLHCHAGVNRSQCVKAAYYYMRTGEQFVSERISHINMMVASCNRGYLPPKAEMEKFLTMLGKQLEAGNMMGGLLDECKIETINNF